MFVPRLVFRKRCSILPFRYHGQRYQGTFHNPSDKIYALPFAMKAEVAKNLASMSLYGKHNLFRAAYIAWKNATSNDGWPIEIRKAYIPCWYFDFAVTVRTKRVESSKEDDTQQSKDVLVIGFNCFWPGHSWDPMCFLSFGKPSSPLKDLVPFSRILSDLEDEPSDLDIIPFTTDPLQSLSSQLSVLNGLQLDAGLGSGTWKIMDADLAFDACYPLYWPVYIARTPTNEDNDPGSSQVVVIDAHKADYSIFSWDPQKKDPGQWRGSKPWLNLDASIPEWLAGFAHSSPLQQLEELFDSTVVPSLLPQKEKRDIGWNDVRIQAFSSFDNDNKNYLSQLFKVWRNRNLLVTLDMVDQDKKAIGFGRGGLVVKTAGQVKEDVQEKVKVGLKKLEDMEPSWFKEYKQANKQSDSTLGSPVDDKPV